MIPFQKVKDIIVQHDNLEKELSTGSIEPKLFAKKSKEYANLGNIISIAREYVNFDSLKKDLQQILDDKSEYRTAKNFPIKDLILGEILKSNSPIEKVKLPWH